MGAITSNEEVQVDQNALREDDVVADVVARAGQASTQTHSSPGVAKRINTVAMISVGGVMLLMAVMVGRVVQLQLAPSAQLKPFISDRLTTVPKVAPTGDILDRRGRPLATTRFGYRVFIDPKDFPNPPDEAFAALADAIGMKPVEIAKRVVPAMEHNDKNRIAATDNDPWTLPEGKDRRYVSVGEVLEDWRVQLVRGLKLGGKPIPGVHLETRQVRENMADDQVAHLVGAVGIDHDGLSGAEFMFGKAMQPEPGLLKYVRDGRGDPMWIFPGGFKEPKRGHDVRLSVDLEIQRIVMEEVDRGIRDADAAGARCVVLDPHTGEVLALADVVRQPKNIKDYDWKLPIPKGGDGTRYRIISDDPLAKIDPALARNRCVEDVYEPGSTFKAFMWSAALASGKTRESEVINTHWGKWVTPYGRPLSDVTERSTQTVAEVLVNSSNIGMAQLVARMEYPATRDAVLNFGFGRRTNIGLAGETAGLVTSQKGWTKYTQTSVAIGYEVGVTPVQMVRAFAAFCRRDELAGTVPTLRLTAVDPDVAVRDQGQRAIPADIAKRTREVMRGVTHNLDERMSRGATNTKQEETFRYEAFGKSGTARAGLGKAPAGKRRPKGSDGYFGGQYTVSFIAGAPVDDPRLVVLVVVDDPGPELVRAKRYYGAMVAGPINRRIMERSLSYLGVEPSVPAGESVVHASTRD